MKIGFNSNLNFGNSFIQSANLNPVNHNTIPNNGSKIHKWKDLFGEEKIYDYKRNVIYITQKGVKDGPVILMYPDGKVTKVNAGWGGQETLIEKPSKESAKRFEKEKSKLTN